MNGIAIARGGSALPLTLSDRLRPPGIGWEWLDRRIPGLSER